MPAIVIGQDECVFKSYALSKSCWILERDTGGEVRALRKKGEGQGWMISAFQDEISGFGLQMSPERLKEANEHPDWATEAPLLSSPGVATLSFGKNGDGYWTMDKMLQQLKAHTHCAQLRYKGFQLVYYFDWSSGLSAMPPEALHAGSMNATWGGKQKTMRKTIIAGTDGFLGSFNPKLKPGDTQHLAFQAGDPPPFYAPQATGYVGKPKGLRQVLYERGLIDVGTTEQPKDLPKVDELREIMTNCYDFQNEETALEQAMHKRGHLLRMTPKGHPELAGVGIEYSWGKAKMHFRKNNECNIKTFHTQVLTAMSREVLFIDRVRKFAR